MLRIAAVSCLCLVLTGCVTSATNRGGQSPTSPVPGSAATFYSVSNNITGDAPCGTSSVAQVLGFPAVESGAATPVLTITSPNTVDRYGLLATDAAGNIYVESVAITQECDEVVGSEKILVFAPATSGNFTSAPIRTIAGPATQLVGMVQMAVDGPGNIYLWVYGNDDDMQTPSALVEFAAGANGNVAPVRTITMPSVDQLRSTQVGVPEGLAVDGSGNIILAASSAATVSGGVQSESDMIEVFTPGQSGNVTPARTISGPASQLTQISGLAADGTGNIYVEMSDYGTGLNPAILEFEGGADATASAAPIKQISGAHTTLSRFNGNGLTADRVGNIYVLDYTFPSGMTTDPYYILRFGAGSSGDVPPVAALLSVGLAGATTH
jgi:hypothetical protein